MAKTEEVTVKPFSEPVKLYRLREGFSHKHAGVAINPKDEIYLNQRQAKAFRDRFEEVDPKEPFKDGTVGPLVRKIVEKPIEKPIEGTSPRTESDKK